MGLRLDRVTSAEAFQLAEAGVVLVVPVGSTEQHGPHLPLGTDTFIAVELVRRIGLRREDVVIAPALALGSSGEHQSFAGTVSIGSDVVRETLLELGRSAGHTFARLLLVSTHGGNAGPVTEAVTRLRYEGHDVRAWAPSWTSLSTRVPDAHAGWLETSLMLAIDARLVHLERSAAGATQPVGELLATMQAGGVAAVSANGVLGDPSGSTAELGEALLAAATESAGLLLDAWAAAQKYVDVPD